MRSVSYLTQDARAIRYEKRGDSATGGGHMDAIGYTSLATILILAVVIGPGLVWMLERWLGESNDWTSR